MRQELDLGHISGCSIGKRRCRYPNVLGAFSVRYRDFYRMSPNTLSSGAYGVRRSGLASIGRLASGHATGVGAHVIRYAQLLCRRFATALAVVAALAFVADGALAAGQHLTTASGGHYHAHAHSHASSDHQIVDADAMGGTDIAAAQHHGSAPESAPDTGANCCSCTCGAAILLPSLNAHAAAFMLVRTMATAKRPQSDGVAPDGLRRPPKPLAIA
jgi:hypothetical protein